MFEFDSGVTDNKILHCKIGDVKVGTTKRFNVPQCFTKKKKKQNQSPKEKNKYMYDVYTKIIKSTTSINKYQNIAL